MAEPVTLAEMRLYLGISQVTDTARDEVIGRRIVVARGMAEAFTQKVITSTTVTAYGRQFPEDGDGQIALKMPLQSVTGITYLDIVGAQQTLSSLSYYVDSVQGYIEPEYGYTWPDGRPRRNAVQIAYAAGYVSADIVPEPIKEAIRFIVLQWELYQSSLEGFGRPPDMPNAARQLLEPYRDYRGQFSHQQGFNHIVTPLAYVPGGGGHTALDLTDSLGDYLTDSTGSQLTSLAA